MSAPDRLAELRRQRALIADHLAWLDGKIAAEEFQVGAIKPPAPLAIAPMVESEAPIVPAADALPSSTGAIEAQAETAMEEFRVAPSDIQRDVRKGCLIYCVVGFVLFAAAIVGAYYALQH